MKYYVTLAVDGRYTLSVDAESFEDAREKAEAAFMDSNIGELECVGMHPVNAEDENGTLIDY